jgi:PAS domain S-box-containing protein
MLALVGDPADGNSHRIEEILSLIHPDDVGGMNAALDGHLRLNEPYRPEFRLRMTDGEYRWVSVVGKAVSYADGNASRLVCALTLINDSKASESDLQKSESSLRALFEGIGDGLLVLTAAGQVLDANAKGCEFLGYDRSDLIQTGLLGIIVPNQVMDGISLLGRVASSSKGVGNISVVHGEGRLVSTEMEIGRPSRWHGCVLVARWLVRG